MLGHQFAYALAHLFDLGILFAGRGGCGAGNP
jgi:hypothetical protein